MINSNINNTTSKTPIYVDPKTKNSYYSSSSNIHYHNEKEKLIIKNTSGKDISKYLGSVGSATGTPGTSASVSSLYSSSKILKSNMSNLSNFSKNTNPHSLADTVKANYKSSLRFIGSLILFIKKAFTRMSYNYFIKLKLNYYNVLYKVLQLNLFFG